MLHNKQQEEENRHHRQQRQQSQLIQKLLHHSQQERYQVVQVKVPILEGGKEGLKLALEILEQEVNNQVRDCHNLKIHLKLQM
ncbi:hypothetical protein WN944_018534 [Citrus x changshan-huyou]|uniref:Uncharacterized protein n=1 Tax=Citrus x changshan-huyou TaxID=2935761 RepID=A0AAP0QEX4_9ROSI